MNAVDLRAGKVRFCPRFVLQVCQVGIVVFLYLFVFASLIPDLVTEWYEHENFSYAFLVPLISLYLLWQDRDSLRTIPVIPTSWGAISLLAALLLSLTGKVSGDVFTMRVSMVLALGGLVHLFMGTRFFKAVLFPVGYLLLMIPPPYVIVKEVSYYLRMLDAFWAAELVQLFGVPVYRDAYFLHLPNITLEVADVCSGIASLFAMLALGIVYARTLPLGLGAKAVVLAGAVVFPLVANLLRIVFIAITVYYYGPFLLRAFFHQFSGTITFILALAMLLVLGEFMRRKYARGAADTSRALSEKTRFQRARQGGENPSRTPSGSWPFVLTVGMFAGLLYLSGILASPKRVGLKSDLSDLAVPLENYVLAETSVADAYEDPNADTALSLSYIAPGNKQVELFVGYRSFQDGKSRLLSPKLNLAQNWNFVWVRPERFAIPDSAPIEASWMLTQKGGKQRLVVYWYQARGRSFAGEISHRLDRFMSGLTRGRTDGAVVRIATPVEDEKIENVKERLNDFVGLFYPRFARIMPE
jgi:EpsI family protein